MKLIATDNSGREVAWSADGTLCRDAAWIKCVDLPAGTVEVLFIRSTGGKEDRAKDNRQHSAPWRDRLPVVGDSIKAIAKAGMHGKGAELAQVSRALKVAVTREAKPQEVKPQEVPKAAPLTAGPTVPNLAATYLRAAGESIHNKHYALGTTNVGIDAKGDKQSVLNCSVASGAGLLTARNCHGLTVADCWADAKIDRNFGWIEDSSDVTLRRVRVPFGSNFENGIRLHECDRVTIEDSEFFADRKSPARLHSGKVYAVRRCKFTGGQPLTIGPMGEGQGGQLENDPIRRAAKINVRLDGATIEDCEIQGYLSINAGASNVVFRRCKIDNSIIGTSRVLDLLMSYPEPKYFRKGDVLRPPPQVRFEACTITDPHHDSLWYGTLPPGITWDDASTFNGGPIR